MDASVILDIFLNHSGVHTCRNNLLRLRDRKKLVHKEDENFFFPFFLSM
jgi:hypothetical protein